MCASLIEYLNFFSVWYLGKLSSFWILYQKLKKSLTKRRQTHDITAGSPCAPVNLYKLRYKLLSETVLLLMGSTYREKERKKKKKRETGVGDIHIYNNEKKNARFSSEYKWNPVDQTPSQRTLRSRALPFLKLQPKSRPTIEYSFFFFLASKTLALHIWSSNKNILLV